MAVPFIVALPNDSDIEAGKSGHVVHTKAILAGLKEVRTAVSQLDDDVDTNQQALDDLPDLTLLFENGLA